MEDVALPAQAPAREGGGSADQTAAEKFDAGCDAVAKEPLLGLHKSSSSAASELTSDVSTRNKGLRRAKSAKGFHKN